MDTGVTIIGTGALGTTLARALHLKGYQIKGLFNRTASDARKLADELGVTVSGQLPEPDNDLGSFLFLTVSDNSISSTVQLLAERLKNLKGVTAAHCSGNETSVILDPLKQVGASTAAFHPLQTFNQNSPPGIFNGIRISLEGEKGAVEQLSTVGKNLGSKLIFLPPDAKPYLHAAAVVASNYLLTLIDMAGEIAELGGINRLEAREALLPLVQTTLDNAGTGDLSDVLSGPVARGDLSTIRKHLVLLEQKPKLLLLYRKLGMKTLELAQRKGSITEPVSGQLQRLLSK